MGRATSFGIGGRPNLQPPSDAPNPNRYNTQHFPNDTRAAPLLSGKEEVVFQSMIKQAEKKGVLPSPGDYNLPKEHGRSFSLRGKLPGQIEANVNKRVPGPGQYKTLQMKRDGRYAVSKARNTRCISFGHPKRQLYRSYHQPSPASYNLNDSSFSDQRIKMLRRNTAKTFTSGRRTPVHDTTKHSVPGPGQYQSFSSFGGSQMVPSVN